LADPHGVVSRNASFVELDSSQETHDAHGHEKCKAKPAKNIPAMAKIVKPKLEQLSFEVHVLGFEFVPLAL
jgi:hypothetical protein